MSAIERSFPCCFGAFRALFEEYGGGSAAVEAVMERYASVLEGDAIHHPTVY